MKAFIIGVTLEGSVSAEVEQQIGQTIEDAIVLRSDQFNEQTTLRYMESKVAGYQLEQWAVITHREQSSPMLLMFVAAALTKMCRSTPYLITVDGGWDRHSRSFAYSGAVICKP